MTRRNPLWRAAVATFLVLLAQPLAVGPGGAAAGSGSAADGGVLAWGEDETGQLGDGGANADQPTPVAVRGLGAGSGIVAVAAGGAHNLALRSDGSVLAWGYDFYGQLGDGGANADQSTPVSVIGLGAGSGVVAVAAGNLHSLALRSDGSVLAWGADFSDQLGDGGARADQPVPVTVSGLGAGSGVVAVAAGDYHNLALRADGSVLAWGGDGFGQLGDGGANADQPTPVAVSGLGAGSGVVAMATGHGHSLAVRSDGSLLSWGYDGFGQLGDGGVNADQPTPVAVSGLGAGSGVVGASAGVAHSLAFRSDGSVLAWGWNNMRQLGDGDTGINRSTPGAVSGLGAGSGVVGVSAGFGHSLAVRSDGSVLAWGYDIFGQLGDGGANADRSTPVSVSGLGAGSGVVAVAAGGFHSLAVTEAVGSTFAPLSPARVWDSRGGPGPLGRIGPSGTRNVTVTGVGGVPATGVDAVVLNVTAVAASADTFVTVWPTGQARPNASNLNILPGDTRPNLVVVKVGAGGQVSFYNNVGTVDLVADVAGWYGASGGQRYTTVSPARVWDSRFGPGPLGRIGPAGTREIAVAGVGGVPATGVTAVVLNVTAQNPSADTFVTIWPTGEPRPLASNLNIPPGDTRPNLVTVKVGAGGRVSFYNNVGSVDLIADVAGYFGATGASLTSTSPTRVWDSRVGPGPIGRLGPGGTRTITLTNVGGISAVILNVTAQNPSADTFVTVWPAGEPRPLASNLNIPPGDTRPNLVVVKVGAGGQVSFYNNVGTVDLIADLAGWYGIPGAA